MQRRILALALAALAGCAGGGTNNDGGITGGAASTQVGTRLTGMLVGRVTDAYTGASIPDVVVKVFGLDFTAKTNADGVYSMAGLPSGSPLTAYYDLSPYIRAFCTFTIPATAANFPLDGAAQTCTVQLAKPDGTIRGQVLFPNGKPVKSAEVLVDQRGAGWDSVVISTTDADGNFELKGLGVKAAGQAFTVFVNPFDENGDGQADYAATTANVTVAKGIAPRVVVTLNAAGQRLIQSNIFDGDIGKDDAITFTFAMPVLLNGLTMNVKDQFKIVDTRTNVEIPQTTTWDMASAGTKVSVKPTGSLIEGDRYTITISVTTAGTNVAFNPGALTFLVRSSATPTPITAQVGNLVILNNTAFNWNQNNFTLAWDGVPGGFSYLVYARDTRNNPGFVLVSSYTGTVNNPATRMQTNFNLPNFFDSNSGNTTIAALDNGNEVTFTVVPMDAFGNISPIGNAPTVKARDTVPPTVSTSISYAVLYPPGLGGTTPGVGPVQTGWYGDAINDDPAPYSFRIYLGYSEPMDVATAPVLKLAATAGVTSTWVWDAVNNNDRGWFVVTLAPGTDATGPFSITGGKDQAGNPVQLSDVSGYLNGRKELLVNPGFEDGNCALAGWTLVGVDGGVAPRGTTSGTRSGNCAAVVGTPAGTSPSVGHSRLLQDVTLPTIPPLSAWYFNVGVWVRTTYQSYGGYSPNTAQYCRVIDPVTEVTIASLFSTANSNFGVGYGGFYNTNLSSTLGGTSIRLVCDTINATPYLGNGGLFVDDASIALVKP